jgi:hypothetical protein
MSNKIATEYIKERYGEIHALKEQRRISLKRFVEIISTYDEVPQHIKDFWQNYVSEKGTGNDH